jgi:hypothetical protein
MQTDINLKQHITAIFQKLLEQGFHLPIHVAVLAVNGSVFAGAFTGNAFEPSAQHSVGGGFTLPINIMLVDSETGDAARVVLRNFDQEDYSIS